MADPGFVSGFIGLGINKIIDQIIDRINIAVRGQKEMASLKDLVVKIKPIITEIQQYRPDINRKKKDKASAVNGWLKQLDALLQQASKMVQTSTIQTCNIISRYQTSLRIRVLISEINEHIKFSPLVELALIPELLEGQTQKLQEEIVQIKESREALASSSTSHGPVVPTGSAKMKLIEEPLIVGQDKAFSILEKLVLDVAEAKSIGVVGKGGSGKTLLLKTLFSSQKANHGDIGASNILFEENYRAKIADFDLAKLFAEGLSHLSCRNFTWRLHTRIVVDFGKDGWRLRY